MLQPGDGYKQTPGVDFETSCRNAAQS